jgi:hypothetical protein
MWKIVPLRGEHLEGAALLVSNRYKRLYEQESHLPRRYTEVDALLSLLQTILNETQTGVAAVRGEQLAGFLTGWQMPSITSACSPTIPAHCEPRIGWASGCSRSMPYAAWIQYRAMLRT